MGSASGRLFPESCDQTVPSFSCPSRSRRKIPPLSTEECTCRNCGNSYAGNFCPRCGQTRSVKRFNTLSILSNVLRAFTRLANGFKRTAIELLWRPGYMMADFIKGKRVRYIPAFPDVVPSGSFLHVECESGRSCIVGSVETN